MVVYNSEGKRAGEDIVDLSIMTDKTDSLPVVMMFYVTVIPRDKVLSRMPDVPFMTSAELAERMNDPTRDKLVTLDVRIAADYNARHIPGALSFPRKDFEKGTKRTENILSGIEKGTPIVVYCGTGYNSSFVAKELIERGHSAYNLDGITKWTNAGYPIETSVSAEPARSRGDNKR
jgi:rhodanese-related sulfurtransferase